MKSSRRDGLFHELTVSVGIKTYRGRGLCGSIVTEFCTFHGLQIRGMKKIPIKSQTPSLACHCPELRCGPILHQSWVRHMGCLWASQTHLRRWGRDSFPHSTGPRWSSGHLGEIQVLLDRSRGNYARRQALMPSVLHWHIRELTLAAVGSMDGLELDGREKVLQSLSSREALNCSGDSHQGERGASGSCGGELKIAILKWLGAVCPFENLI